MTTEEKSPVYFASLTVGNVKCFKEEQTIDLTNKQGNFAQWTVILGNNNTGKTTLLQCLAGLKSVDHIKRKEENFVVLVIPLLNKHMYFFGLGGILTNGVLTKGQVTNFNLKICSKIIIRGDTDPEFEWGWIAGKDNSFYRLGISESLEIFSYGINRIMQNSKSIGMKVETESDLLFSMLSNFLRNDESIDIEEWLLQTYLAEKNGVKSAGLYLEKVKKVLISGVLPDVKDLSFETSQQPPYNTYVLFDTDYGKLRLHELGYGYQSSISWLGDLMKRQFDRYPDSENPLAEPAIVLVDEIDMHLHPEWQRKIIRFLSHHFPKTQFIVTSHSPLVVQSAENVNVVLLNKEGDKTIISQPDIKTFKGWTVVEILEELMGLEGKTRSESYLELIRKFNQALYDEDLNSATQIYEKLDEILYPHSNQRTLLSIQMAGIIPKQS